MNLWNTLPETNSLHLKIGHPKRKRSSSNHPFSGAMLASGRVVLCGFLEDLTCAGVSIFRKNQKMEELEQNPMLSTQRTRCVEYVEYLTGYLSSWQSMVVNSLLHKVGVLGGIGGGYPTLSFP